MALTTQQLISLGFKPSKRSSLYNRKYDTLIYPINETDFIYTGYNPYSKKINNKILWKSFKQLDSGERITYPIINLGDTGFNELKRFIERCERSIINCATPSNADEANAPNAVEEGSGLGKVTNMTEDELVEAEKEAVSKADITEFNG